MEFLVLIIGLSLALFFTAKFVIALWRGEPFFSRLWDWLKNVFDSIT